MINEYENSGNTQFVRWNNKWKERNAVGKEDWLSGEEGQPKEGVGAGGMAEKVT